MVLGAAIVVMPNIAAALDIGGIAQSLKNQFGFVGDLIGSAIFIAGIVVGPAGLFECYKATKDRGRGEHTYVRGGLQTLIGSAMIGLPILLGVGVASMFNGGSGQTLNANSTDRKSTRLNSSH